MKTMTDVDQLLREYVQNRSESAFRELVCRYINFVYSTALRLMNNDRAAAEDVTQTVFIHLAQNAGKISGGGVIGGWLHRDACFVASKMRRTDERRRTREQEAAFMNAPQVPNEARIEQLGSELEEAINELGEEDRHAILLRFYERRDFRTVGTALGTSEDAARMRVGRALNKLQALLGRRGVATAGALGSILLNGAASAAPAGLAATVSTLALTSAASVGTVGFMGALVMTKTKMLVTLPVLIAGATSVMLWQSHSETQELRNRLADQNRKIDELILQNSSLQVKAPTEPVASDADRELLKLRGEVNVLKKQLAEASAMKAQFPAREVPLSENEQRYMNAMLQEQYLSRLKMQHTRQWMMGVHMYAVENGGRMPEKLDQVRVYIGATETNENGDALLLATNELGIAWRGSLTEARQKDAIVLMSAPSMKVPGDPSSGWVKIYGMADGRVERAESLDGDFSKWEEGRIYRE